MTPIGCGSWRSRRGTASRSCRRAVEAGLTILGENRIQEAEPKIAALPDVEWHLVGRLQSNKARRAVRALRRRSTRSTSLDLLRRVATIAPKRTAIPTLLLQVNVSGEASKAGMAPAEVVAPDAVASAREAGVDGPDDDRADGRIGRGGAGGLPEACSELRDRLEQAAGIGLPELSMGMSADAEAAAAEGATLVRIGTALFGPRSG